MLEEEKNSITKILIAIGKGIDQVDYERRETEREEKKGKK